MTRCYDIDDVDTLAETFGARQARRISAEGRRLEEAYIESLITDKALMDAEDAALAAREERT
jgi:hypothetical protein